MTNARFSCLGLLVFAGALFTATDAQAKHPAPDPSTPVVDDYKITILSDSIPGRKTIGEWGFSAIVEITSGGVTKRFLFDTSDKPDTVLFNAERLGINLCDIEDVVVSHHHADHTGGLVHIRETCKATNPLALSKAHVGGEEIFWSRRDPANNEKNPMVATKPLYEAAGGTFIINDQPHQFLLPGVFLTGGIARPYDEKTYLPATPMQILDPSSGLLGVDYILEDQAVVINTSSETVVLTGCAHAGAINTLLQAQAIVGGDPYFVLAGGLHWFDMERGDKKTVGTIDWEADSMNGLNVIAMLGGHCTGFERFFYVRDYLKYSWSQAAMAAVGTSLGIDPRFTFTLPQAVNIPMGSPKNKNK